MKKSKNLGIVLLEFLIVFGIISILSLYSYVRLQKVVERREINETVLKISQTIDKYSIKSLKEGILYKINLDYKNNEIKIKKVSGVTYEEIISFPSKIRCYIPYTVNQKEQLMTQLEIGTTLNGNLSDSFTTYIFDYSNKITYRIATYNFQENKILKINIYQKVSGEDIFVENLLEYHKLLFSMEELENDWRKQ